MWDNWRQRKEPRKHQHTASVMRGLRTDCPFPVLPVALQSWEGGGAIQTFFADVVPVMDGLEWKTVSKGQWLATPNDHSTPWEPGSEGFQQSDAGDMVALGTGG